MVEIRQEAFNSISKVLAITRYDIEQRQSINDLSLNIHGENYFRDIFNFVYGRNHKYNFENDNFNSQNSACIDLVDHKNKLAYQITTTRTKAKISNTLDVLNKPKYKDYAIRIFYLLDKAKVSKDTVEEFSTKYGIDLKECLIDYTDLIKEINNLETNDLISLDSQYFKNKSENYTDEIVLNLVFKHLIANSSKVKPNYDDDFGTVDTREKIKLNKLNSRTINNINRGLDYITILDSDDSRLITDLRALIIDELYEDKLKALLYSKVSSKQLDDKGVYELQNLAEENNLDFNKLINNLHQDLENKVDIKDFNSTSIGWIIIAYFFEICDIGIKE